ncbi:MAG: hypothetical protein ABSA26_02155 [Thermoguttaceae bacterium]|jgi:hypothetical protein
MGAKLGGNIAADMLPAAAVILKVGIGKNDPHSLTIQYIIYSWMWLSISARPMSIAFLQNYRKYLSLVG